MIPILHKNAELLVFIKKKSSFDGKNVVTIS